MARRLNRGRRESDGSKSPIALTSRHRSPSHISDNGDDEDTTPPAATKTRPRSTSISADTKSAVTSPKIQWPAQNSKTARSGRAAAGELSRSEIRLKPCKPSKISKPSKSRRKLTPAPNRNQIAFEKNQQLFADIPTSPKTGPMLPALRGTILTRLAAVRKKQLARDSNKPFKNLQKEGLKGPQSLKDD